jgi:serine-type D-Ala-D-Ala carboxypeptidase (penicillin-binding protein 5/6)
MTDTPHEHTHTHKPAAAYHDIEVAGVEAISHSSVPTGTQLLIALAILGGLFGVSYLPWFDTRSQEPSAVEQALRNVAKPESISASTHVAEPHIESEAAFVWDVRHQRALYNKNASARLPLASLTKLMTSLVALETLDQDARVPMTIEAILQDGPSDFVDGEVLTAQALSDFALVSSSNDGAYALASAAASALDGSSTTTDSFIDAMNARAAELGLTQTMFMNPTGLDQDASTSGGYGSARDIAFLIEYLITKRPDIVLPSTAYHATVAGETAHTATNTNDIIDQIPGLLATKTGYTALAGGNLAVAFDAGLDRPIIVVALGSSREGRFDDVRELIAYAQSKLTEQAISQ